MFILFSCSKSDEVSDENNNQSENILLVKEITHQDRELSNYSYKDEYFYDGAKLVQYVTKSYNNNDLTGSATYNITYTNNLIVDITSEYGTYKFSYDTSGRLEQSTYCDNDISCGNPDRGLYSYSNSDKTITIDDYSQGNLIYTTIVQLDSNNNVISFRETVLSDNSSYTVDLQYDNFKSPFLNIIGAAALINPTRYLTSSGLVAMKNNCVSFQGVEADDNYNETFDYDYNYDGYPRQVINNFGYGSSIMQLIYASVNND
ncbi:MAG: hypothetical protein CMC82_06915 [Flavobacteriaceae bacterium]|nr:hypothetical protein [Flavobacteriaceae bacterium]|tara:strand:+ start:162 stop:941 length:780 start_codon:yes stop_codon:yes gene_type:complete